MPEDEVDGVGRGIDPLDPTLPLLRRAARRKGRRGRWLAAGLVGLGIGFVVLIAVAAPTVFAQALGYADHHQAVVETIRLSPDQPGKKSVRSSGPAWNVRVRWDEDGHERRGTGVARGRAQPYQVGQTVRVATARDGHEVSFRSTGDARGLLVVVVVMFAAFIGAATFFWHPSKIWQSLPRRVCATPPKRVRVEGTPERHRRRATRGEAMEQGLLVDYRALGDDEDVGRFLLLYAEHGRAVHAGDDLDIWSADDNPGPPFAVRRPSDGLWWLGSHL